MAECQQLAAWAEALPLAVLLPASQDAIERNLEFLAATLPSRAIDTETGKSRLAVYTSVLLGCSDEALRFMGKRVVETCKWFPTPKECLDLLAEFRPAESERAATLRLCSSFAHATFAGWLANVGAGQPVGDVPEQWCRIAVERGVMRRLSDGSYVSRALYHGPFKAWAPEPAPAIKPVTAGEPMREAA